MDAYPEDWSEDDVANFKDTVARILAGFEQVRETLDLSWQEVNWKRMRELAERVAMLGFDFKVEEALLIGTWLLGSARQQIQEHEVRVQEGGE